MLYTKRYGNRNSSITTGILDQSYGLPKIALWITAYLEVAKDTLKGNIKRVKTMEYKSIVFFPLNFEKGEAMI